MQLGNCLVCIMRTGGHGGHWMHLRQSLAGGVLSLWWWERERWAQACVEGLTV